MIAHHRAATEQHDSADEIERLNRLYAALSQVHQAMIRVQSRDELFRTVCRVLGEQGGFCIAWIGWHVADTSRLMPVAEWGDRDAYLQSIRMYTDDRPEGRGPAGTAFREDRTVVSNDLLNDAGTGPWRPLMTRRGLRASGAFPIRQKGEACGILGVYADKTGFFHDKEVALLEEAAANLSFALDNQAREQEQERQRVRLSEAQAVAHIGSWDTDLLTGIVAWSDETHRIFETDPSKFGPTHDGILKLVHPEDRHAVNDAFVQSTHTSSQHMIEHRLLMPDGRIKVVEERWKIFRDDSGVPTRATGTCQEITDRKRAEAALRESEERARRLAAGLRTTLESITDAFYTLDRDWRFTYVNHEAERIMQRARDDLLGRSLWELFPELRATEFGRQLERAVADNVSVHCEGFYVPQSGWFELRAFPSSQGLAVYFRDVTERRLAAEQLRALARRLESVQELERSAIAREVHDELGQALTVLRMDSSRLARMIAPNLEAAALVADMTVAIEATLQETRSIALALHPSALDDLGLAAAIEIHVGHVARRADLRATLDLAPLGAGLDRDRASAAYRVLQESLTNVVRHAGATEVIVRLAQFDSGLALEVTDNGRGIESEELRGAGSLGLLGMRERAAVFNGSVTVTRAQPIGTTVALWLPFAAADRLSAPA